MSDVWPYHELRVLEEQVNNLGHNIDNMDVLACLRVIDRMNGAIGDAAISVLEIGARAGLTQTSMAHALGVPPSTLRGLKAGVR